MSRSYPYNIILTRSKEVVNRLFFNKYSLKKTLSDVNSTLTDRELKQSLIVSPKSNNGFLDMEVNFPGQDNNKRYVAITLLESSKILETFPEISETPEDKILKERLKRSRGALSDDELDKVGNASVYYLAYGVGDDLDTWSGPYVISLMDASLSITEQGVRKVELLFTPALTSLKAFSERALDDSSYATFGSSFDKSINKTRKFSGEVPLKAPNPDWNVSIRNLIREYVGGIFNDIPRGNILPLFNTNLNAEPTEIRYNQHSTFLSYQGKLASKGISLELVNPSNTKEDTTKEVTNEKVESLQKTRNDENREDGIHPEDAALVAARNEAAFIPSGSIQTSASVIANIDYAASLDTRPEYLRERERQGKMAALSGEIIESKGIFKEASRQASLREGIGFGRSRGSPQPDKHEHLPSLKPWEGEFKMRLSYISSKDSTLLDPLYAFYNGLKEDDTSLGTFVIFEENDKRILKLLKKYGFIESDDDPVVLIGDRELIGSIIYRRTLKQTKPYWHLFLDKFIINDLPTYWGELDFVLKKSLRFGSSFNESFDFGKLTKQLKKHLNYKENNKDIIFTHNVTNSNVLSLSFTNSPYKAVFMNIGADSEIREVAQNQKVKSIVSDNSILDNLQKVADALRSSITVQEEDTEDSLINKMVEFLADDDSSKKVHVAEAARDAGLLDLSIQEFITMMVVLIISKGDHEEMKKNYIYEKTSPGNVPKTYMDILRRIREGTINVSLKTLPFFNNAHLFQQPCYLFGVQNDIVGSNFNRGLSDDKLVPSVFTGRYMIVGVKHYMSNTDAYSEFTLIKNGYNATTNISRSLKEVFKPVLDEADKASKTPKDPPPGSGSLQNLKYTGQFMM
jgi:hypothetical protein